MSLLAVEGITGGYGETDILFDVSMRVDPGEIVVVVGPNGAGKSTAMKAVFGMVSIRAGHVLFEGDDITGMRPDRIVRKGICYVPQTDNVFPSLSVEENLDMGAFIRNDDIRPAKEKVFELFPPLEAKRRQPAGTLSGGQRQMVAMGRALMLEPMLLLLDEPTAGLSPKVIDEVFETISEINRQGIGMLMVEQNAAKALAMADRGYVLASGRNRFEDTGPNLLANREVAEMFLGG